MKRFFFYLSLFLNSIIPFLFLPFNYLPGPLGNKIRYLYYKRKLKYLGKYSIIDIGVVFINPEYVSIGENVWIDKYTIIEAGPVYKGKRIIQKIDNPDFKYNEGELFIGNNCHIGTHCLICGHSGIFIGNNSGIATGCKLFSLTHFYKNNFNPNIIYKFTTKAKQEEQSLISGPIVMQDNTALGVNSIIFPGITIYENSWIGACSMVTKNIPSDSIAVGIPARVIKKRFDK